jgi:rhomboid-like protein
LAIFLASGAVGGYSSLAYNVMRSNWKVYIFGSSGAALGVLSASCVLRPNGTLRFWGYDVPIAAWVFLGLYGIGEVVAVVRVRPGNIDHVGHVGGMVAGAACAVWLKMRTARAQTDTGSDNVMKKVALPNPRDGAQVRQVETSTA